MSVSGWYLKSVSSNKTWTNAKIEWNNDSATYGQYIYDLSGSVQHGEDLIWNKINTHTDPILYSASVYWMRITGNIPPTLTLIGSASITSEKDISFNDSGASALNYSGVDLTSSIIVTGSVNINVAGTYTLEYNVTDSLGTSAVSVSRTVTVVDTVIPVITLTGDASLTIDPFSSYTDLGATATDFHSDNLTSSIIVNNPVDIGTAGTYVITYNVSDVAGNAATEVIRTVIVRDLMAPVITLTGGNVEINIGDTYDEPGFTAIDNIDGDVESSVVVTNSINNAVKGVYTVKYNVSDSAGNASEATRLVIVKEGAAASSGPDTTAPIITLIGDASVDVNLGDAYIDAGATASDDVYGNVTNIITTTSTVDANVEGAYTVKYNVTDPSGNAAIEVTRTVIVSDPPSPKKFYSNAYSFAALKPDGSVVTWGYPDYGGDSSSVSSSLSSGVSEVYAGGYAFAALKDDGSVVSWGDSSFGGDSSSVSSSLTSDVSNVYFNAYAFAALKSDGSVATWGHSSYGGDSSSVSSSLNSVSTIYTNKNAFAALKTDGSVVTWGDSNNGGNSSSASSSLSSDVSVIYGTEGAFAALKTDGSVVTWGSSSKGGDSSSVSSSLSSGVSVIYSGPQSFAALKDDGSVVTWGNSSWGGDSSSASSSLNNVVSITSNRGAFAALKADGSVVVWGTNDKGGNTSYIAGYVPELNSGVSVIYSTSMGAFAALKTDGSVVTWGSSTYGGSSSSVSSSLSSGVSAIYPGSSAFAALKTDGSVVTWGSSTLGGDSSSVSSSLSSGVTVVYVGSSAFAALKDDGSVVTWGTAVYGGDSSSVDFS